MFVDKIAICEDICDEFSETFAVVGPESRCDEVVNSLLANLSNLRPPVIDAIFRLDNQHQICLKSTLIITSPF